MIYILSLGAGGIRGAFTLGFLEKLEIFLNKELNETIHSKFDYFAGSSTGALIACSFSHENLDCNQIFDKFYNEKIASKIMHSSLSDKLLGLIQFRPKYNGIEKTKAIRNIARFRKFNDTSKKVLVPIYDVNSESPFIVKSYESNDLYLSNVLDAASAAPGYFPGVYYNSNEIGIDSGLVTRNPALNAYLDARKDYPNSKIVVLSIGTGKKEIGSILPNWGGIEWATKGDLIDLMLDGPSENIKMITKNIIENDKNVFIDIDSYIPDHNLDLDNTTQDNIDELRTLGHIAWDKNKYKIISAFENTINEEFDRPETPVFIDSFFESILFEEIN